MKLKCKVLEQVAFSTRLEVEDLMLNVADESIHEEQLYQPIQTKKKTI